MEKWKPTFDLDSIRAAFADADALSVTSTALRDAAALGFDRAAMVTTIQSIERSYFYKSMTSYADPRIWQDVYHVPSVKGLLYVTFTSGTVSTFTLLSFKEKDSD